MKYKSGFFLALFYCLFSTSPLNTAMTGGNFEIYADAISFIDSNSSTGGGFTLTGTGGELTATTTATDSITLRGGFQALERGALSFSVSRGAVNLGPLSQSAVSTAEVMLTVSTDSNTGYTATAVTDGPMRSGRNSIPPVTDGAVTSGVSEYGIRTTGSDGLLTSDRGFNATLTVASANGEVDVRETIVRFSASTDGTLPEGNYSQVVTFTVTANP